MVLILGVLPFVSLWSIWLLCRATRATLPVGVVFALWLVWAGIGGRLLSITSLMGNVPAWMALEAIPIAVAIAVSRSSGSAMEQLRDQLRRAVPVARHPEVAVTLIGVMSLYALGLVANFVLPQTMDDSLTAYLARVGFWINEGSISHFETSPYNFPIVAYPALPTLSSLRWVVLTGTDRLAALDQWLAALACASLLFGLARRLKVSARVAVWMIGVWLTSSVVILQSQMVLNDLVALVFLLAAVWCGVEWFQQKTSLEGALAVLFILCAVGTKQTILFLGPSVLVSVLVGLVVSRKSQIVSATKSLLMSPYLWVCSVLGLWLAAPEYISNQLKYGHPLGPESSFIYFSDTSLTTAVRVDAIWNNLRAVVFAGAFGDVPTWVADAMPDLYAWVRRFYEIAGLEYAQEQGVGWFGLVLTGLAVLGLFAGAAVAWKRRTLVGWGLLAGNSILFAVLFLYTRPNFSEAFSRYMLIPVTLLSLTGALVIDAAVGAMSRGRRRVIMPLFLGLVVVLAMTQGAWSLVGNGTRPLAGPNKVWGRSDNETMLNSNGFLDRDSLQRLLGEFERCIPQNATVGAAIPNKFPLSRLFGPSYSRDVRFVFPPPPATVSAATLSNEGWSALILDDVYRSSLTFDESELVSESFGQYTLYRLKGLKPDCG